MFTIVTAGGWGHRFGSDLPKQYIEIAGKPLLYYAVLPFSQNSKIEGTVIVVARDRVKSVEKMIDSWGLERIYAVVEGGKRRQDSVAAGLAAVPNAVDAVLVHDGSRPCVSTSLVDRVLDALKGARAVIPALRVRETVKKVLDKKVLATVPRDDLWLVQTPQGFDRELLQQAMQNGLEAGFTGTDESSFVERMGEEVEVVEGDLWNIKVTYPGDMEIVRAWLERGEH